MIYFTTFHVVEPIYQQALGFDQNVMSYLYSEEVDLEANPEVALRMAQAIMGARGLTVDRIVGQPMLAREQRLAKYAFPEQIYGIQRQTLSEELTRRYGGEEHPFFNETLDAFDKKQGSIDFQAIVFEDATDVPSA